MYSYYLLPTNDCDWCTQSPIYCYLTAQTFKVTTCTTLLLWCAVYVVFGATGGVGSDLVRRLVGQKAEVVLGARSNDKLEQLKAEIGGGHPSVVDVLDSKQVGLQRRIADQVSGGFA